MVQPALSTITLPIIFTLGGLSILLAPWLIRLPRLAVVCLVISLVFGQTVRFPLPGQGGGVLLSDIAVVIVLIAALIKLLRQYVFLNSKSEIINSKQILNTKSKTSNHKIKKRFGLGVYNLEFALPAVAPPEVERRLGHRSLVIGVLLIPFILWSAFTLAINAPQLGLLNTLIALSYWLRLIAHLLLLPALLLLFQRQTVARAASLSLLITITILVLLGLAQFIIFPNMASMTNAGWDPHNFRLVGSWLDPNFFGAFLAIVLPFVLTTHYLKLSPRIILISLIIISLILTQSRSALLALTIALLILSPLYLIFTLRRTSSRHVAIISLFSLVLLLVISSAVVLAPRLYGLITPDATVQLRASSLKQVWNIAEQYPFLGVGYNAYQFAAKQAGLISDFQIHSRAGADNSFLTLWVTTGLTGLFLFLVPWAYIIQVLLRLATNEKQTLALTAITSILILFVHAQIVNSLLYSHLLITLIVITALALNNFYSKLHKTQYTKTKPAASEARQWRQNTVHKDVQTRCVKGRVWGFVKFVFCLEFWGVCALGFLGNIYLV